MLNKPLLFLIAFLSFMTTAMASDFVVKTISDNEFISDVVCNADMPCGLSYWYTDDIQPNITQKLDIFIETQGNIVSLKFLTKSGQVYSSPQGQSVTEIDISSLPAEKEITLYRPVDGEKSLTQNAVINISNHVISNFLIRIESP